MFLRTASVVVFCVCGALALPPAMLGTWKPSQTTQAILGPLSPYFLSSFAAGVDPDTGDTWMSLLKGQLFRVTDDKMQYCFSDRQAGLPFIVSEQAPFYIDSQTDDSVTFCWRGNVTLRTHAKDCTGCDCAQISLTLTGTDSMEILFLMSPPVIHAHVWLARSGSAPAPSFFKEILADAACEFEDHTGNLHPVATAQSCSAHPSCVSEGLEGTCCPTIKGLLLDCCQDHQGQVIAPHPSKAPHGTKRFPGCAYSFAAAAKELAAKELAVSDGPDCALCGDGACSGCQSCLDKKDGNCELCWVNLGAAGTPCLPSCLPCWATPPGPEICHRLNGLNNQLAFGNKDIKDVHLQYVIPSAPCSPCDVTYSVSSPLNTGEYIAVGFKGFNYFYHPDYNTRMRPSYFGMAEADDQDAKALTDRIALGYHTSGGGCFREMQSVEYVGTPVDVAAGAQAFTNTSVANIAGRTVLRFTVSQTLGDTDLEISTGLVQNMRTMWAVGMSGGEECDAPIGFHSLHRGVSPQAWFSANPACPFNQEEFTA